MYFHCTIIRNSSVLLDSPNEILKCALIKNLIMLSFAANFPKQVCDSILYTSSSSSCSTSPPLHVLSTVPKISSLRGEIAHQRQTIDAAQQELQLPVSRSWSILRYHMTRQIDRHKGQASFCVCRPKDACACQCAIAEFAVVRHEKGVRWCRLESLRAIPCHVLDHE